MARITTKILDIFSGKRETILGINWLGKNIILIILPGNRPPSGALTIEVNLPTTGKEMQVWPI